MQVTNHILSRTSLVMKKFTFILILILTTNLHAQKKYNFGLSVGSEQFYGKDKGYSPMHYSINNSYNYKVGFFVERNLKNNDEILVGFNYNYYWNYFQYLNGNEVWKPGISNTFYDMDIHYNHLLTNRFKVFLGTNVSFYRFHDKYFGEWYLEDRSVYATEVNDVTDFNVALNTGIKYEINPKSKIKFEHFVLIGATLFKRDNFKVDYPTEGVSSNHFYKHIYTRFGLNIKY